MVVGHKVSVPRVHSAGVHLARQSRSRILARGGDTGDAPQTLPPCLQWRERQARLTHVNQRIRTLEKAAALENSPNALGRHADGFWYAAAVRIVTCFTRRPSGPPGPARAERLEGLKQEAQMLDGAILRERIASLTVPEHQQLQALVDARRPTSFFAPQLATFFAAQAMDDTGVAEAYLASLELIACDRDLSRMQADKTFDAAAVADLKKKARLAAGVCGWQLDWLGAQEGLYDLCTRHAEALQRWQRHFGLR